MYEKIRKEKGEGSVNSEVSIQNSIFTLFKVQPIKIDYDPAASRYKTAILTATPFSTWSNTIEW